ncbi:MAG: tRNA preQ1(34) S-adenosylmethionine ribosyltransferase-isomerase QueA [Deltaproteobacteria bacterium]|nr:tRNA preQ1(34) S-adenosylmethionine ribosyltransferase-isomerase QueA [Deltaproteobacteria bacterium]
MLLSDFDYHLPPELIAQEPASERSSSRLLVVDRSSGGLRHVHFSDLGQLLPPDSLLVLNDTKVFPARLRGRKDTGGIVEILLLHRTEGSGECWEVLCKGGQSIRAGARLRFPLGVSGEWIEAPREGRGVLRFSFHGEFHGLLEKIGEMPLPPYIKRADGGKVEDRERYQTVYARQVGAVAAPTAGLHFTEELLVGLRQRGIEIVPVTLHVGAGTFQPIRVQEIPHHQMEEEEYQLSAQAVERIIAAKQAGRKIIAVGTTTTRALESAATELGLLQAGCRRTSLFIYPGYRFKIIDGLITNFHLPQSTLLLLVAAFAGRELILNAYAEAAAQRYRFYSYGDAMVLM